MIHNFRFNVLFFVFFLEVNTCFLTSVVFPSAAFNIISPRGQYNFLEVFAEDVVEMQILREHDSI